MHEEDDWPRRGGRRSSRPERGERPSREGWGPPRRGPRIEKHVRHGFGPGPFWMGDEPKRRARVKRGDVRAAVLALLAEEPRNGYQIIQEIAARSGGVWQPSPGSVYPALQQLKDEGLIHPDGEGFSLTDEGRTYMTEHADEVDAPWEVVAGREHGGMREMRPLVGQVAMAAMQVVHAGSEAQIAEAQRVLKDTRRSLYRILAADDDADEGEQAGPAGPADDSADDSGDDSGDAAPDRD